MRTPVVVVCGRRGLGQPRGRPPRGDDRVGLRGRARPGEWADYHDPFGDWHEDACEDVSEPADADTRSHGQDT